jgi:hypothetical protein
MVAPKVALVTPNRPLERAGMIASRATSHASAGRSTPLR